MMTGQEYSQRATGGLENDSTGWHSGTGACWVDVSTIVRCVNEIIILPINTQLTIANSRDTIGVPNNAYIYFLNRTRQRPPLVDFTAVCLPGASRRWWISVFIPPKSAHVNFLWGKITSERLFNSFTPPKNFTPPKQISGDAPGVCTWSCSCFDAFCTCLVSSS